MILLSFVADNISPLLKLLSWILGVQSKSWKSKSQKALKSLGATLLSFPDSAFPETFLRHTPLLAQENLIL